MSGGSPVTPAEVAGGLTAFWRGMHPSQSNRKEQMGYGLVGILVIILLIVLIFYFVRRA